MTIRYLCHGRHRPLLKEENSGGRHTRASYARMVAVVACLSIAVFALDVKLPIGVATGVLYAAIVAGTWGFGSRRSTLLVMVACMALTVVGYFLSPRGDLEWVGALNRMLSLVVIGVSGVLMVWRYGAAETGPAQVETLRGETAVPRSTTLGAFLPVCSGCDRIRDAKGTWNEWELYIQAHSESQITHGLCPECVARLYMTSSKERLQQPRQAEGVPDPTVPDASRSERPSSSASPSLQRSSAPPTP